MRGENSEEMREEDSEKIKETLITGAVADLMLVLEVGKDLAGDEEIREGKAGSQTRSIATRSWMDALIQKNYRIS